MPLTDRSKLTALTPNLQNGQQANPTLLKDAVISLFDTVDANFTGGETDLTAHVGSTTAHAAQNITYAGNATGTNVKAAIDGLKTTVDGISAGAATDANIGARTITDTSVPTSDTGTLTTLLSWLGNMIKSITGKANWRTAPRTTLENAVKRDGDTMTGRLYASIGVPDTRAVATTPNDYNGEVEWNFKSGGAVGLSPTYSAILGVRGWTDSSGGNSHELAFGGDGLLYTRNGATTTWGAWSTLWDTSRLRDNAGTLEFFSGGVWKSVGPSSVQATYTRSAQISQGYSFPRAPRVYHTILDIQNKKGMIMAAGAFATVGTYEQSENTVAVGGAIYVRVTIDDQVETIGIGIGAGGSWNGSGLETNYGYGVWIINDQQYAGGDNQYQTLKRQDPIYFSKNFKLEFMGDPTQAGYTNNQVVLQFNVVRYALHIGT